ncbi:MAG: bifunctional phosphopantothenoylcysteine decarboxylase/phosphopantothenate--cysteine ligase CoaBC [Chitinispirillaceae bacterium]|nr:bifunctional phosphopantothenoylcysteine decarboxylase/phosphopantothenate--cysteine ligase CoaBC [Chitinispirillaceae bacterium]
MRRAARILVGITGGIAAYKVPQLIRLLRKQGAEIKAVCTPDALAFIGSETLRTVCGHPLYRDGISYYDAIEHVRLAEWADLFLICPATANTIAKIAHGIADNLLTTLALSLPSRRLLIAPAMNAVMWQNAVTQENIALLEKRGCIVLPVGEGELACASEGPGRMLEIDQIADAALAHASPHGALAGKRLLIASGATEEPLDPVRVITNRSSGKMGAALARAALQQGAKVVVVSGPARHAPPYGARVVQVTTADEMRRAMEKEFTAADICIMAAAVSDFRPVRKMSHKVRRRDKGRIAIELAPNPDIAALLGKRKGKRCLVGFALETREGEASARAKMKRKRCDMMILNRAHEALGRDDTRITILTADGSAQKFPVMAKTEAAVIIMQHIAALVG